MAVKAKKSQGFLYGYHLPFDFRTRMRRWRIDAAQVSDEPALQGPDLVGNPIVAGVRPRSLGQRRERLLADTDPAPQLLGLVEPKHRSGFPKRKQQGVEYSSSVGLGWLPDRAGLLSRSTKLVELGQQFWAVVTVELVAIGQFTFPRCDAHNVVERGADSLGRGLVLFRPSFVDKLH